jgi:hypothetical protein
VLDLGYRPDQAAADAAWQDQLRRRAAAPKCTTAAQHTLAVARCKAQGQAVKGLGALTGPLGLVLSTVTFDPFGGIDPCYVEVLPLCTVNMALPRATVQSWSLGPIPPPPGGAPPRPDSTPTDIPLPPETELPPSEDHGQSALVIGGILLLVLAAAGGTYYLTRKH